MNLTDTLNLLGAKYKSRSECGWNRYEYELPTGEIVTVQNREYGATVWFYGEESGFDTNKLWTLAWPKVLAHRQAAEKAYGEKCDKAHSRIVDIISRLAEHLRAEQWGEVEVKTDPENQFRKYQDINIYVDGKCEVWVTFEDDGSIGRGIAAQTEFTGIPSMKKVLFRRYEFKA